VAEIGGRGSQRNEGLRLKLTAIPALLHAQKNCFDIRSIAAFRARQSWLNQTLRSYIPPLPPPAKREVLATGLRASQKAMKPRSGVVQGLGKGTSEMP
jgi:hypothetical protein